jgi:hypothetical protein
MGDSMSTIINATTTNGVVIQPDNSGSLVLQTNSGTTALTIDTSQRAAFVAGTAAAPAITTTGDTNTGMFFPAADTIAFAEGGAESMRIDSSGNVGIGVTPSAWTSTKAIEVGSLGSALWSSGAGSTSLSNGMYYNSGWKYANGTSKPALLDFDNVGKISTYTVTSTGTAGNATSLTAGPYVANGGTSWTNSSDERLKNITGEIANAINKVSQLRAAEFTWKLDELNKPQVGLIAQDLLKVLPEVVVVPEKEENEDGTKNYFGVNYDNVIPLLVAAIQEQQTIINDLKARVETLEAK